MIMRKAPNAQLPTPKRALAATVAFGIWVLGFGVFPAAQQQGQGRQGGPAVPRTAAPVDLTGTWVSLVTEDWRWRMVTPAKGDVSSLPLNAEGRKVAESWDPATDGSCRAYGAAAVMRMPGRVRISWEGDATLKVETDA